MKIVVNYVKGRWEIDLPEGATVADAISAIKVPVDDIGFAIIDGKVVRKDYGLKNGDEVTLYAAIVGG